MVCDIPSTQGGINPTHNTHNCEYRKEVTKYFNFSEKELNLKNHSNEM